MSFFGKIKSWLKTPEKAAPRQAGRSYLVEGAGLLGLRGGGRVSPAEQVQLLQRLARFARKEHLPLTAVLEGKALREVQDGGAFDGVTVFFADRPSAAEEIILKRVREGARGQEVTVITERREIEERVQAEGGHVMRAATFRKAMEGASGGMESRPDDARRRRRRKPRPSRPRPEPGTAKDTVHDLIDLVE